MKDADVGSAALYGGVFSVSMLFSGYITYKLIMVRATVLLPSIPRG